MQNKPFNGAVTTRLFGQGNSTYSLWPKVVLRETGFKKGDTLVIRTAGEKVVIERIPMDKLGFLRTGEAEQRP